MPMTTRGRSVLLLIPLGLASSAAYAAGDGTGTPGFATWQLSGGRLPQWRSILIHTSVRSTASASPCTG